MCMQTGTTYMYVQVYRYISKEEGGRIFQVKACDSPKLDFAIHTCVH